MRNLFALLVLTSACRATLGVVDVTDVDADNDGFLAGEDCNDSDPLVFPGATELCNGIDDDCNGLIDDSATDGTVYYADSDGDGYGAGEGIVACEPPGDSYVTNNDDCDDTNSAVSPDAIERCNGIDDNCSGTIDDSTEDGQLYFADTDGDGFGDPDAPVYACEPPTDAVDNDLDCDDTLASVAPGGIELCNGLDDDCDGIVDNDAVDTTTFYVDIDGDGFGSAVRTVQACAMPDGYADNADDCDDSRTEAFPGAVETCNMLDDNCNGIPDDDPVDPNTYFSDVDGDGYGDPAATVLACVQPAGSVNNALDCDDTRARVNPLGTELCNGLDDDCNGLVDDEPADPSRYWVDADGDRYGARGSIPVLECSAPQGYVSNAGDCDDTLASVSPSGIEVCNGIDDDCDGDIDENAIDAVRYYGDSDGDQYGAANVSTLACEAPSGFVTDNSDCNDGDPLAFPGADERCNGSDDDCDGVVDNDPIDPSTFYADTDGDLYGDPTSAVSACSAPDGYVTLGTDCDDTRALTFPGAPETCNELDDDCDGNVDNDPIDGFLGYPDDDRDGAGAPGSTPIRSCDPGAVAPSDDDCDDTDASVFPGSDDTCLAPQCPPGVSGPMWLTDPTDEAMEAFCDDGWMRIAHLAAGERDQASVYRTTRFFMQAFVQGSTAPTVSSNSGVLLDDSNFGMVQVGERWQQASELRWSCIDHTRQHTAQAVVALDNIDRDALLNTTTYDSASTPVVFTYDGVSRAAQVYLTQSSAGYWGSWHICGAGSASQGTSPGGWQLGVCATPPGVGDSGLREIAQVAIGYHEGFSGIRLECGNDTPSNTSTIEGSLSMWLR